MGGDLIVDGAQCCWGQESILLWVGLNVCFGRSSLLWVGLNIVVGEAQYCCGWKVEVRRL